MVVAANPEIINPKACFALEGAACTSLCPSSAAWPAGGFSNNDIVILLSLNWDQNLVPLVKMTRNQFFCLKLLVREVVTVAQVKLYRDFFHI